MRMHLLRYDIRLQWQPGKDMFVPDVENVVSSCVTCQQFRKNQAPEPLISHDIPDRPWAKLAVDLFSIKGINYLILVDYYSKFPEIAVLPSLCSSAVIDALKNIFSRLGIPEELISDNGSNLVSDEFNRFCTGGILITVLQAHVLHKAMVKPREVSKLWKISWKKPTNQVRTHTLLCWSTATLY